MSLHQKMTIELIGKHKSLNTFKSEPLPKFVVITGKNGSGKSQLLELIQFHKTNRRIQYPLVKLTPQCNNIQFEGIPSSNIGTLNSNTWKSIIAPLAEQFINRGENLKSLESLLFENDLWFDKIDNSNVYNLIKDLRKEELEQLIIDSAQEMNGSNMVNNFEFALSDIKRRIEKNGDYYKVSVIAKNVSEYLNKQYFGLKVQDFFNAPIPEELLSSTSLFSMRIENVFYNYSKKRFLNHLAFFNKKELQISNESVSDKEFLANNPEPWRVINNIFEKNNIDFEFEGINPVEFSPDSDIKFRLLKKSNKTEIHIDNLSSGEKIIIGLIIKLFATKHYDENLQYPDLLMLDEPDAHLHPEMSKLLIDILHKTFSEELGIKVIMTSHSPSTIAISPESSLYQLKNHPETSLTKIDKDSALELLTGKIPTLSIDYKNHRQVFVESPTDVYYYQTLYDKISLDKNLIYKLYFISNGYGKSNCEQVYNIVTNLRESGNNTSYGIVDWDLKNSETEYIRVHGLNNRYSIENFIYDPIYIIMLLMTFEGDNIYKELKIPETTNEYEIINFSNDRINEMIKWFFNKYYEKYRIEDSEKQNLIPVHYLNNKTFNLPNWYIKFQGHDLENRIKSLFMSLENRYRSEGSLQKALTKIIAKCYPFIPIETSELIIKLSS